MVVEKGCDAVGWGGPTFSVLHNDDQEAAKGGDTHDLQKYIKTTKKKKKKARERRRDDVVLSDWSN